MELSTNVKSVSYLKAHAADILKELSEVPEPFLITQNGEAKAVIMNVLSYEQMQESIAFMKIVALGRKQTEEGKTISAAEAFKRLRERRKRSR